MACGTYLYREDLGWIDEGRGVGAKLAEEIAESVDEQEPDGQLLYVRDNREQTESAGHHTESETLDGFAAQFIHGQRRDGIARCRKHDEDSDLRKRFLQEAVVAAQSCEHQWTGDGVSVIGKVEQKPCEAGPDQAREDFLVVYDTMKAIPKRHRVSFLVEMRSLLQLA